MRSANKGYDIARHFLLRQALVAFAGLRLRIHSEGILASSPILRRCEFLARRYPVQRLTICVFRIQPDTKDIHLTHGRECQSITS